MALNIQSIYFLWYLCSDLIYAILFPQLFCVIYVRDVNTYGALMGYIVAVILRVGGGEKKINLDPFIKYPYYNEIDGQLFPFRTLAMLCSFATIILVSFATKFLFSTKCLPKAWDVFNCFSSKQEDESYRDEPPTKEAVKLVGMTRM